MNVVKASTALVLVLTSPFLLGDLPLEPDRTVEFETSEATWVSLDVHPSNKKLVIEVLGDLYSLSTKGGEATQLTQGMGFDSQPRWSPDGSSVAFISDRSGIENLWVMDQDGSNARMLSDTGPYADLASPSWSPKGDHVIVSKGSWGLRTYEIWAYHLDGGNGVKITDARTSGDRPYERSNALGGVYSSDGRYLFYAFKRGGFGYDVRFPLWQIVRRDLREDIGDYLTGAQGSAFSPRLSPDGTQLVYGTRFDGKTGLRIRNLSTGSDDWLAFPVQRDEQESRYTRDLLPGYSFSPDGKHVYAAWGGQIRRISVSNKQITTVPFTVRVKQSLGPRLYYPYRIRAGDITARLARDAQISPDGNKIAFSAFASVYVYDIKTGKYDQVSAVGDFAAQPRWSSDGRRLAFVTWSDSGGHVWTYQVRRKTRQKLTSTVAFYSEPVWSADDREVYALRATRYDRMYRESDWGHVVGTDLVAISTGRIKPSVSLVRHSRGLVNPHLGPEQDRIYLYLTPGLFSSGDSGLVSIRRDGSDYRTHLTVKGPGIYYDSDPVPATLIEVSPNGRYAAVNHANQLHLFRMLDVSSDTINTTVDNSSLPSSKVSVEGIDSFGWTDDSTTVYWTAGNVLYRRDVDSVKFGKRKTKDKNDNSADDTELDEDTGAQQKIRLEVTRPRYAPEGTLALVGGSVITMATDDVEVIEGATIVVRNSRIAEVGKDIEIPSDATVIDISGTYVVPGYVDTHAHYRFYRSVLGRNNWSFLASLAYGVTTGIDVQPSTVDIIEYEDLIDTGRMVGPRALSTGPGIFRNTNFEDDEDALAVLLRYKLRYGVHNLKAYIHGSRKQRQLLVRAAKSLQLMPTTEGALDLKLGLTHVIDGYSGHEHNFPVVDLYRDVVQLAAQSKIAYTPTLLVLYGGPAGENYYYSRESPRGDAKLARFIPPQALASRTLRRSWFHEDEHIFSQVAANARKIVEAGGRVGVGSHGQLQGLGFHWELWALHSGGFTNYEALRAATRHGAEMIGIAEDVGSVESGKLADLVILERNPLDDIRATDDIKFVVKNGELFEADTLEKHWPHKWSPSLYWWPTDDFKNAEPN